MTPQVQDIRLGDERGAGSLVEAVGVFRRWGKVILALSLLAFVGGYLSGWIKKDAFRLSREIEIPGITVGGGRLVAVKPTVALALETLAQSQDVVKELWGGLKKSSPDFPLAPDEVMGILQYESTPQGARLVVVDVDEARGHILLERWLGILKEKMNQIMKSSSDESLQKLSDAIEESKRKRALAENRLKEISSRHPGDLLQQQIQSLGAMIVAREKELHDMRLSIQKSIGDLLWKTRMLVDQEVAKAVQEQSLMENARDSYETTLAKLQGEIQKQPDRLSLMRASRLPAGGSRDIGGSAGGAREQAGSSSSYEEQIPNSVFFDLEKDRIRRTIDLTSLNVQARSNQSRLKKLRELQAQLQSISLAQLERDEDLGRIRLALVEISRTLGMKSPKPWSSEVDSPTVAQRPELRNPDASPDMKGIQELFDGIVKIQIFRQGVRDVGKYLVQLAEEKKQLDGRLLTRALEIKRQQRAIEDADKYYILLTQSFMSAELRSLEGRALFMPTEIVERLRPRAFFRAVLAGGVSFVFLFVGFFFWDTWIRRAEALHAL